MKQNPAQSRSGTDVNQGLCSRQSEEKLCRDCRALAPAMAWDPPYPRWQCSSVAKLDKEYDTCIFMITLCTQREGASPGEGTDLKDDDKTIC